MFNLFVLFNEKCFFRLLWQYDTLKTKQRETSNLKRLKRHKCSIKVEPCRDFLANIVHRVNVISSHHWCSLYLVNIENTLWGLDWIIHRMFPRWLAGIYDVICDQGRECHSSSHRSADLTALYRFSKSPKNSWCCPKSQHYIKLVRSDQRSRSSGFPDLYLLGNPVNVSICGDSGGGQVVVAGNWCSGRTSPGIGRPPIYIFPHILNTTGSMHPL